MTKTKKPDASLADDLVRFAKEEKFYTVLADPPWQFQNRTGKMAPEHKRLSRYGTLQLPDILSMPVAGLTGETAHLYLWVPNALLPEGIKVMAAWGFEYKSNIVWHKIRKDGGPDGRGVGFYFRNTTELILFGVRGKNARTLAPGRRQVNIIKTQKREHSRKPDELYDLIEACSPGPYLELFARGPRKGWRSWGDQADDYYPSWATYSNHSGKNSASLSLSKVNGHKVNGHDVSEGGTATNKGKPNTHRRSSNVEPADFVERALRASATAPLGATEAYEEYARQCATRKVQPIEKLPFWRLLSAKAADLGVGKSKANGRIFYSCARLSTAA